MGRAVVVCGSRRAENDERRIVNFERLKVLKDGYEARNLTWTMCVDKREKTY